MPTEKDKRKQRVPRPEAGSIGMGVQLQNARKAAGMSQQLAADRLGMSVPTYRQFEKGAVPSKPLREQMAKLFDVSESSLTPPSEMHDEPRKAETAELPVFGDVPAGPPAMAAEMGERVYHPVLRHQWSEDRYVLRIKGSSMSPELKPGDLVLVEYLRDPSVTDLQGKICVCLLNGESTIKRLRVETQKGRNVVLLESDNPVNQTIYVKGEDDFEVQGRVLFVVQRQV